MRIANPPIKWFGGKWTLARHIHALAPPHTHRVYLFGGGAGEMWNWPGEGVSEHYNDADGRLANLFAVLRSRYLFPLFVRRCEATEFGETVWEEAGDVLATSEDSVERAWAMFVRVRLSFAGLTRDFAPPCRRRVRRGMDGNVSAWLSSVDGLTAVHARCRRLYVTSRDAVELIAENDTPATLFYADPPYVHATRTAKAKVREYGAFEMDDAAHVRLLDALGGLRHARFILSGYPHPLYDGRGWGRQEIKVKVKTSADAVNRSCGDRTECLWFNWEAA